MASRGGGMTEEELTAGSTSQGTQEASAATMGQTTPGRSDFAPQQVPKLAMVALGSARQRFVGNTFTFFRFS